MTRDDIGSDAVATQAISTAAETVDEWLLDRWSSSDLVTARAQLRLMLTRVEQELGKRGLMRPHR